MSAWSIPFNRACLTGREHQYIDAAVRGGHISGNGPFSQKCEQVLEECLGVSKALLTTSCTHALEMAALVLGIRPGDEILVPSFTFVSTVSAFVLRGARPVFVDIRPDTLNMDESQLEAKVTERTRAIVPVHYAGVACELDAILAVARLHGLVVVEDNAHGLFGTYRGRQLGTFGCMATQSFHETKNITCGEGGALLLNDPSLVERAEVIREKGTDRGRFFRGQVDKYTWVDVGSSYILSDILAAYLLAQLEDRTAIQRRRSQIWHRYETGLQSWAQEQNVRLPVVPEHCGQAYHMFYLLLPTRRHREALIEHLKVHGILSVFHYVPLHLSNVGRGFGGTEGLCPITEDVSDRLLRLPFFNSLSDLDQNRVIAAVTEYSFEHCGG